VMAVRAGCADERVRALIALGFPISMVRDPSFLIACTRPRLFVQGADDVFVFGGGIIPREDIPKLKEKGIEEIFTPGAPTSGIVEWLRARLAKKAS